MAWEKSSLTSRSAFEDILGIPSGYNMVHGGRFNSFLKPFTTNTAVSGLPHYTFPINTSGLLDSVHLNPFGIHTYAEGLVYGTGLHDDLEVSGDAGNVRTFGYKTPCTYVGWGYDQWGFAAPNYNTAYRVSGVAANTIPSGFLGSGNLNISSGCNVPYPLWQAGPIDLSWDHERGVWFCDNGIYPAQVIISTVAGGGANTSPQLSENVTYYAKTINRARIIYASGTPIDKRPAVGTYMIQPLVSGDYCEIVCHISGNKPMYGIVARERFAPSGC